MRTRQPPPCHTFVRNRSTYRDDNEIRTKYNVQTIAPHYTLPAGSCDHNLYKCTSLLSSESRLGLKIRWPSERFQWRDLNPYEYPLPTRSWLYNGNILLYEHILYVTKHIMVVSSLYYTLLSVGYPLRTGTSSEPVGKRRGAFILGQTRMTQLVLDTVDMTICVIYFNR